MRCDRGNKSLGLLSVRCRASQAPCWACVLVRRSTKGYSGTSDGVSVEQMSSRELKSGCSSTGFCAGVWTAGEIRRTRWTSGWKERTRSIISSLDRRTLLIFLSRRRDELLTHMDRYCCASVILKNRFVSSCLVERMNEMARSYLFRQQMDSRSSPISWTLMYNGIDGDLPVSTTYFPLLILCAQRVRFLFPSRDLSQVLEIDLEYREGLDDLGKSTDFWVRPSRLVSQTSLSS